MDEVIIAAACRIGVLCGADLDLAIALWNAMDIGVSEDRDEFAFLGREVGALWVEETCGIAIEHLFEHILDLDGGSRLMTNDEGIEAAFEDGLKPGEIHLGGSGAAPLTCLEQDEADREIGKALMFEGRDKAIALRPIEMKKDVVSPTLSLYLYPCGSPEREVVGHASSYEGFGNEQACGFINWKFATEKKIVDSAGIEDALPEFALIEQRKGEMELRSFEKIGQIDLLPLTNGAEAGERIKWGTQAIEAGGVFSEYFGKRHYRCRSATGSTRSAGGIMGKPPHSMGPGSAWRQYGKSARGKWGRWGEWGEWGEWGAATLQQISAYSLAARARYHSQRRAPISFQHPFSRIPI